MSEKNIKQLYLDFDEYIRQGEPDKKEKKEWKVQPNLAARTSTPTTTPTTTRTSSSVNTLIPNSKLYTNNNNIIELVRVLGYEEMSIKQMMEVPADRKGTAAVSRTYKTINL